MMAGVSSQTKSTVAVARSCALRVLRRVFEQGAYAEKALVAEAAELDPRDRALAMRLAYGAVQRKGTLDHLIEQLTQRAPGKLDPLVLAALRLGLYELLYLDGSPDYAVVGDAVELAKQRGRAGHGLVNAVLRRAAREGSEALLGALSDATPAQAAVKHSHPQWIAELWWKELGPEQARALMACDNEPGEVALRANTLLTDASELAGKLPVRTHPGAHVPEALVLDEPFDSHSSPLWAEGAFIAQSRAAMLVSCMLAPAPGERVLDLCAAPGGKSTHLAALMEGRGELMAVERNRRRAAALKRTAERMRAANVNVEIADAALPREPASFDRVLVDPPCSGLGTLQARPDLRWRASPEAIEQMRPIQAQILAVGADALRPGGLLVYSTCTVSPTENELLILDFLDSHPEFAPEDLATELPTLALRGLPTSDGSRAQTAGSLLTLPHRDGTAGFFIARLRKA
jgi:16S rRNA (cytosine967-C5)-methyltransferase